MGGKLYLYSVIMIKFSQGLGTFVFAGAYTPTCFIILIINPHFYYQSNNLTYNEIKNSNNNVGNILSIQ